MKRNQRGYIDADSWKYNVVDVHHRRLNFSRDADAVREME
jgi:hypothetical protein